MAKPEDHTYHGRQEIMFVTGLGSWDSVRRWKRNCGLPVKHVNGRPILLLSEYREWVRNLDCSE